MVRADPALAVVSGEKGRYAPMMESFDEKNIGRFVQSVLRGGTRTFPVTFGKVAGVEAWDGEDGQLPEEEPLDAYD